MGNKKVLVIADLHSGHRVGLYPSYLEGGIPKSSNTKDKKYSEIRKQCWSYFDDVVHKIGRVDILIINGDAIDGRGSKSGSTELIKVDRDDQVSIAVECIMHIKSDKRFMTYGTAYHTGEFEDWETRVSEHVRAENIGAHEWLDINGVVFDIKHHVGSSTVPYGRATALGKDRLWNVLWAEHEEQPKSDIIIRSHVHAFDYCGNSDFLGIKTPALQAMGSKYGSRRCSGRVDFGMIHFEIDRNGRYQWFPHIAKIKAQKAQAIKL